MGSEKKLKIGIITYIYAVNHGSILQAESVKHILKYLYPNSLIKYINYAPKRGLLKEIRHNLVNPRFFSGFKIIYKFYKTIKKFPFWNKLVISDDLNKVIQLYNKLNLDIISVGSDTVWENRPKGVGYAPEPPNAYFISNSNVNKTNFISIAASSDRSIEDSWPKKSEKPLKKMLTGFKFITVRDSFTQKMLKNKFNASSYLTPDPTFFLDHDKTINNYKLPKSINKNFAVLDISDRKLSRRYSDLLKKYGLQIVAPMTNRFADINLRGKIDPWQWALLHYKARFVVTNRFHGTIFSIKGLTNFISIDQSFEYKKGAGSKKRDLLERANLLENYISISKKINHESLLKKLYANQNFKKYHSAKNKFKKDWIDFLSQFS